MLHVRNRIRRIKELWGFSVPARDSPALRQSASVVTLARAKQCAALVVVFELCVLAYTFLRAGPLAWRMPYLYVTLMSLIMLLAMAVFLPLLSASEKNAAAHPRAAFALGLGFGAFTLSWCAALSLMDAAYGGAPLVYSFAMLVLAALPYYAPAVSLLLYCSTHAAFFVLFLAFVAPPYTAALQCTVFAVLSWGISAMRYKRFAQQFADNRIIQEKNRELERVNAELQKANKKLQKLSQTDGLTGVFNRFMFDQTFQAEWERCRRQFRPLSLLMIDIDFFKPYNDCYGHPAGDLCIQRVASVLSDCAQRASDTVARYGGEEFAVILPYTNQEDALELARRMQNGVRKLAIAHLRSPVGNTVTISIGVHTVTPTGEFSKEAFLRAADDALYKAKKRRDEIVVA